MGKAEQKLRKLRKIAKQERLEKKNDGKLLCERCRKKFFRRDLTVYDPYNEELFDQKTPCKLCKGCAHEALMDV